MKQVTDDILKKDHYLLYIHTPFCGTCHLAKSMLTQMETTLKTDIFYEMNASLFPEFLQEHKVESVPCLLIKDQDKIMEKIYAFHSIANLYHYLLKYEPDLFDNNLN